MTRKINIKVGGVNVPAELNNSQTAGMIFEKLPLEGLVRLWGEEIYFEIPVTADLEDKFEYNVLEIGDIAYWPQGRAFCIFFGQTPISIGDLIKPVSPVNIIGRFLGDPQDFKKVKEKDKIIIEELK